MLNAVDQCYRSRQGTPQGGTVLGWLLDCTAIPSESATRTLLVSQIRLGGACCSSPPSLLSSRDSTASTVALSGILFAIFLLLPLRLFLYSFQVPISSFSSRQFPFSDSFRLAPGAWRQNRTEDTVWMFVLLSLCPVVVPNTFDDSHKSLPLFPAQMESFCDPHSVPDWSSI